MYSKILFVLAAVIAACRCRRLRFASPPSAVWSYACCDSPHACQHANRHAHIDRDTYAAPNLYADQNEHANTDSTPTIHPDLADVTIDGLRAREYPGGQIQITHTITVTDSYTRTYITYPSDGLTISGLMHVPFGPGPFPVIILNHGYIPPSRYVTGSDTYRVADILARNGYLTISPDFRGLARSDDGLNLFRSGYMIDALNAAASARSLPYADANRVGMWGHSMGGGVTTRAMVVSPLIRAHVLYAPVSADVRVRRFTGGLSGADESDGALEDSYYYWTRDTELN